MKRYAQFLLFSLMMVVCLEMRANVFSDFRQLTSDDGLPNDVINTIYKDQQGFIWIGTPSGVARFDGTAAKCYLETSLEAVWCFAEMDSTRLWFGTETGLWYMDRRTARCYASKLNPTGSMVVEALLSTPAYGLVAGTGQGVYLYADSRPQQVLFSVDTLSQSNSVVGVVMDQFNDLWVATQSGLFHYNPKTGRSEAYSISSDNSSRNRFTGITMAGNTLYLGTYGYGVACFDLPSRRFSTLRAVDYGNISFISSDRESLYVGSQQGAMIVSLSTEKLTSHLRKDLSGHGGLKSSSIYCLLRDEDQLWVGTYMSGLYYTPRHSNSMRVYGEQEQFDSRGMSIRSFWICDDGRKLVGTRDGLYLIDPKRRVVDPILIDLGQGVVSSNVIVSIQPLSSEDFLICSVAAGVFCFNINSRKCYPLSDQEAFRTESFFRSAKDGEGGIWLGTDQGVYRFDPKNRLTTHFHSRNSAMVSDPVYFLSSDSRGRVWIGGRDGLAYWNPTSQKIEALRPAEEVDARAMKRIRYVYEDREHRIWICPELGSPFRADADLKRLEVVKWGNSLDGLQIFSMVQDQQGGYWLTTPMGMVYSTHLDGSYRLFAKYDGLPGTLFNNSVQVDSRGNLWWGNELGLVWSHPSMVEKPDYPRIIMTDFYLSGKEAEVGKGALSVVPELTRELSLSSSQNNISFRFVGLDYRQSYDHLFEYCLEGVDEGWRILKKYDQLPVYKDLGWGRYRFRVRYVGDPESEIAVRFYINISPFFYWLGAIILISAIMLFIQARRNNWLKRDNQTIREILSEMKHTSSGEERKRARRLSEDQSVAMANALVEYMRTEKPFLSPDLKLQEVSTVLHLNLSDVSYVINSSLGQNFTEFLNSYRVEEFKQLVASGEGDKYTLTALSERCGFSSRSSFFRIFKAMTNQTPLEYLKEKRV